MILCWGASCGTGTRRLQWFGRAHKPPARSECPCGRSRQWGWAWGTRMMFLSSAFRRVVTSSSSGHESQRGFPEVHWQCAGEECQASCPDPWPLQKLRWPIGCRETCFNIVTWHTNSNFRIQNHSIPSPRSIASLEADAKILDVAYTELTDMQAKGAMKDHDAQWLSWIRKTMQSQPNPFDPVCCFAAMSTCHIRRMTAMWAMYIWHTAPNSM